MKRLFNICRMDCNLQYKMFLLNATSTGDYFAISRFTIQNVPIKSSSQAV